MNVGFSMLDLHTLVGIERFCSCCFVCQHIVCMTLHLSADYMYSLWAVAFVKNLSIPTPPIFPGFRNVATTASLFNAVTVSMSWLCRLISCNIMVLFFLRLHRWKVCTHIYLYLYWHWKYTQLNISRTERNSLGPTRFLSCPKQVFNTTKGRKHHSGLRLACQIQNGSLLFFLGGLS